ncbi:MAG: acyl-CoA reductase [Ferruginibacter sp.]|nr:acyl-CoA reductase [Ferruginibacter sp.]
MNLQERINILFKAAAYIKSNDQNWLNTKEIAYTKNGWFTPTFIQNAANQIANNFLDINALQQWAIHYHLDDNITPKNIGIVMAGNIPMVGFQDMLAVFVSGHHQTIKLSTKDDILIKHFVQYLSTLNKEIENYITFADTLKGCDAYIATGSNNTATVFNQYFGKYPHIIRKNKTSVAILTGNENAEELRNLANDIHMYFGLGCRNVTKIYVPKGYDFIELLKSFDDYKWFADHHKYKNNYDYNLSIILLNHVYYMTNEATLLVENNGLFSPISQVFYEFYEDANKIAENLSKNVDIQCIVGNNFVPFGQTQKPNLFTYADGVDTMEFLLTL